MRASAMLLMIVLVSACLGAVRLTARAMFAPASGRAVTTRRLIRLRR